MGYASHILKVLVAILSISIDRGPSFCSDGLTHGKASCMKENMVDPEFSRQAFDYQPESLIPSICQEKCALDSMDFAALRGGDICLCGSSSGRYGAAGSGMCNLPCTGSGSEICGGQEANTVYKTPELVLGLALNIPEKVKAMESQAISVKMTRGSISSYEYEFDDVTPEFVTSHPIIRHIFSSAGPHTVTLYATDESGETYEAVTGTDVGFHVKGLELQCPEANTVGEPFSCNVTLKEGSGVELKVEVTDGTVRYFYPPDTQVVSYGDVMPGTSPDVIINEPLVLLLDDVVTVDGFLSVVEVNTNASGGISLVIYRPTCQPSLTFCFHSYTCIQSTAKCDRNNPVPSIWRTKCQGSDRVYSISKRKCVFTASGNEVTKRTVYDIINDINAMNWELKEVDKLEVKVQGVGFNQIKVDGEIPLEKGDLFVMEDTENIVQQKAADVGAVPLAGQKDLGLLKLSSDFLKLGPRKVRHLIRTHVVRPFFLEFTHNFTRGLLSYRITAQATSNATNTGDTKWFDMEVQAPIEDIDFEGNIIDKTNSTVYLRIKPHTGSQVVYFWDFGDGEKLENITDKNTSHYYGPPGVYNLILVAENGVSRKEKRALVIIQDPVFNLSLTVKKEGIIFGQDALMEWSIDQGTDVIYTIETEGKVFNISESHIEGHVRANVTGFTARLLYIYQTVGNFSFRLNASNLVSWEEITVYLPVQEIIKNFRIADRRTVEWRNPFSLTLLMDYGSHVEMNASLNEISISNLTMSDETREGFAFIQPEQYSDVGTQLFTVVYENLVTAPKTYTKEVKVQYYLTNVTVTADEMFVTPGTRVTFNLTMIQGSGYTVVIDYGYGSRKTSNHEKTVTGDVVEFTNKYTSVGNYSVGFSLWNDISSADINLVITVQNPVTDFELKVDSPLNLVRKVSAQSRSSNRRKRATSFLTGKDAMKPVQCTATLTFKPSKGVVPPTDAFYFLNFDDGPKSTIWEFMNMSQATYVNSYAFTQVGSYNVTMNVSNLASFQNMVQLVEVDQPIEGPEIRPSLRYVNVSQEVTVYITLTWGSRVKAIFNWGDGISTTTEVENYYDQINMTHRYSKPKNPYTVKVTLSNSVSAKVLSTLITIEHPIELSRTTVECHQGPTISKVQPGLNKGNKWKVNFFCKFSVINKPYPTAVKYSVNYGDGAIINGTFPVRFPGYKWTATKTYIAGGDYLVTIDIYNQVSHLHMEFYEEVIEELDSLKLEVNAIRNGTDSPVPPKSVTHGKVKVTNYFSMEDTINIVVLQSHGTHVKYTWDMDDGEKPRVTHSPELLYDYKRPGHYMAKISAQNNATKNTKHLKLGLHIQNEIQDIAISCPTPKPRNESFPFEVHFGSFGFESCYAIDFVEKTPDYAEPEISFQLYGNHSQCQRSWPKHIQNYVDNPKAMQDHSKVGSKPRGNMTVDYMYWTPGVNMIKLYAENVVSKQEYEWRMVVTRGVCYDPVMDLHKVNTCFDIKTLCNTNLLPDQVPQHYRSRILAVRTNVKPNCTSTQNMKYTWTVHRVNITSWENLEELDEKTLKDTVLTSRELRIRYRILDYGVYRFTLNVSMVGEIGIEKIDSVEYEIVKTPLKGNIQGGREAIHQWDSKVTIDAHSQTYDPDVDPEEREDDPGLVFYWFCKLSCEQWPTFSEDGRTALGNSNSSCGELGRQDWDTGCLYKDGKESPHALFTNTSAGKVTFNSTYMFENSTIELKVVVWKDDRTITLTQFINIKPGDPPSATLICVTNCDTKYNPNDRFSVQLIVEGKASLDYSYSWDFFRVSEFGAGRAKEPVDGWIDFVSTGVDTENLALDPGFFKINKDFKFEDLYYFLLKVWRTSGSNDNFGTAAHSFKINPGPMMRKVEVTPESGIACETVFLVTAKPCTGTELLVPITYDAFYRIKHDADWTLFWSGNSPEAVRLIVPEGREPDGALDIKVKCTDRIGSFSEREKMIHTTTIQRNDSRWSDPGLEDENSVEAKNIENLLSSDPARAPECSISLALPALPTGAGVRTTTTMRTTTTTLGPGGPREEEEGGEETTADPSYVWAQQFQAQQSKQAEYERMVKERELLATNFSNVIPTDLSQANIIAASVSVIMEYPEQNTFDTLIAAVATAGNITILIHESIHSQEASAGQIDEASRSCICLYSRILETLTTKAKYCRELLDTDVNSMNLEQAMYDAVVKKQEECNSTIDQIEDMLETTRTRMTLLGDKLMKIKVNSESATVVGCGGVRLNADRQFAQDLGKKVLKTDDVKVRFPEEAQNFFGGENDTAYAYEIQTKIMDVNPYNFANDSFKVSTPVMFFSLKNESHGEVDVENSTDELTIILPRSPDMMEPEKQLLTAEKEFTYYMVDVEPDSALIIRVTPFVNDTGNETTTVEPSDVTTANYPPCLEDNRDEDKNDTFRRAKKCPMTTTQAQPKPASTTPVAPIIPENVTKEWEIYIKESERPKVDQKDYEYNCSLPLNQADVRELLERSKVREEEDDAPDMYTCFVAAEALNRTYPTRFFVAIRKLKTAEEEEVPKTRQKRSAGNDPAAQEESVPPTPKGSLEVRTSRCVSWDQAQSKWSPEGCRPGPMTKGGVQQCLCKKTGTFAADFIVPPNLPDLSQFVFARLNEEPLVFSVMLSILCLYFVCLIWARKADKIDDIMAGATPLPDNVVGDNYLYELVVYTGSRSHAGTTARVYIMLVGDKEETKVRCLHDNARPALKRSGVDRFVMSVSRSLGRLTHIRIWHDNSGADPSWFFSRMQVTDLQTQEKVFFMCDRWLAVEEDDGAIERVIPIAGAGELVNFQHLFYVKARRNLSDSHLWFSVLQRPVRSRFTRVQRLTCCLVLIFTAMMASIMFYKTGDQNTKKLISIGPLKITLGQIFVGIVSSLIAIPVSMLVISLFRYARPKPPPKSKYNPESKVMIKHAKPVREINVCTENHKNSRTLQTYHHSQNVGSLTPVESVTDINVILVENPEPKENPKIVQKPKKMKKGKKFSLPYWCVYLGYGISVLVVLVTMYMTVGIAIEFGKTKAREWLVAFVISFFESVLFSQPLKVFILATFYALLIKKPDTDEEEEEEVGSRAALADNEEWLHKHPTEKREEKVNVQTRIQPSGETIQPLDTDKIKAARKRRIEELQMRSVLWDVSTYVFFLILLMVVAYSNKSPHAFNLYKNFKDAMVGGVYGNSSYNFKKVTTRELLWEFVQKTLVPTLYNESWYNNITYRDSLGFFADKQSVVMGEPRLRLLRTKTELCPPALAGFERFCRPVYSMSDQDETSYRQGWNFVNKSDPAEKADAMWSFKSRSDLKGFPYFGDHATYSGGGYVAGLGVTNKTAQRVIKELIEKGWLDRMTRVVFMEYLIYNDNVKLFGACMSAIEFIPTGGLHSNFKFYVIRLNPYVSPQKYVTIITEVLLLLFIIYFFFVQLKLIYKQKVSYFKKLANIFEFAVVVLCIVMVVYFFYRLFVSMEMEKEIKKKPNQYHNFGYLVLLFETYNYLLAFITALSTIKFINLLRFNKKMSMLGSTLLYAMSPLLNFLFMFMFVFLAFAMFSHLMFGSTLLNYSTLTRSMETLFSAMLNKFDYYSMEAANRIFGPIILFSFTLFVGLMLLNVFVTVIIDAFYIVKYDLSKQSNEHEMIDFIIQRVSGLIGRKVKNNNLKIANDEAPASNKINLLCNEGGPTDDLSMRVDQLLEIVEKYIVIRPGEKHSFQEEMIKLEEQKKTKILYISG